MGRLDGRVAIVTGAAKGLGEADARLLAEEGARVILTDVDDEGARSAEKIGRGARFVRHDVSQEAEWEALVADVMAREGRLDILVNNAGIVEVGSIENATLESWRRVMGVSADGTFFGCKHAIPAMKQGGRGSIINMSSVASIQGEGDIIAYTAAKGAIEAMTRSIAVHCAQRRLPIRCNSLHPSGMDTPMVRNIVGTRSGRLAAMTEEQIRSRPRGTMGVAEDVAHVVVFLATDDSRYINGQKIIIDNSITVTPGFVPAPEQPGA